MREMCTFYRHGHTVLMCLGTPSAQEFWWSDRYGLKPQKDSTMDISPTALVSASTQMQQSQVAQTAQVLVLKRRAMDIKATGTLALLQALPLAPSGNLGTQVNTMAYPLTG